MLGLHVRRDDPDRRPCPGRRRAVVVLHELEGAPPARIARLLGLRPATVRWHLSVGRKELARLLLAAPEE